MTDYPDIYADAFGVTAGRFGVTLTFQLSQPTMEPGAHENPSAIVARIRIGRELAQLMSDQLREILAKSAQTPAQTTSDVKH